MNASRAILKKTANQGGQLPEKGQADPEEYLTIKQVGLLLNVHRMTIYRWIGDGKLPAARLNTSGAYWRIKRRDAAAMLISVH